MFTVLNFTIMFPSQFIMDQNNFDEYLKDINF